MVLLQKYKKLFTSFKFTRSQKRMVHKEEITISGFKEHNIRKNLTVHFSNGNKFNYNYFWLKDNDPSMIHPQTFQRLTDTTKIDLKIKPKSLDIKDDAILIEWDDSTKSVYTADYLLKHATESPIYEPTSHNTILWSGITWTSLDSIPITIDYGQLMDEKTSRSTLYELLHNIYLYGFAIVQNTPPTSEATMKVADMIGIRRSTIFGDFWDYEVESSPKDTLEHNDTAYTSLDIKCHTDGTYYHSPPGLQVFHCLKHDGTGGNNLLIDGFHISEKIKERDTDIYDFLTTTDVSFYYKDDKHSFLWADKIIKLNEKGAIKAFRFNNHDRSPPSPSMKDIKLYNLSIKTLQSEIENKENMIELKLNPGMVLITNNWRILHGRREFTGNRRMAGCYIDYDMFLNKYRLVHPSNHNNNA